MGRGDPQIQFIHLVRLSWDLKSLGVCTSLVLPVTGPPVLEVFSGRRSRVRITAVRRDRGWFFVWRPWWARLWRPGRSVWADADNVADIIATAASA
ncbi:hypothetical protein AB0D67_06635 [Streptosporangium sp. NPDC048047]|uniref:hypothetical protein n=1 Tax=Streptosporangium sp. NPDC048047 TaxID=3155748 RepID=UPI003438EDA6